MQRPTPSRIISSVPAAENALRAWYALYTRPNFEKRVDAQLQEMGLHSYLPLRSEIRQWSDRKKRIQVPLFSCYVFVHTTPTERLQSLSANGVVRMLCNNGKPSQIPEEEIETVRQITSDGFNPEPVYDFVPGELVEIVAGPLKGRKGILDKVRGRSRVVIMFDNIGQSVAVSLVSGNVKTLARHKTGSSLVLNPPEI